MRVSLLDEHSSTAVKLAEIYHPSNQGLSWETTLDTPRSLSRCSWLLASSLNSLDFCLYEMVIDSLHQMAQSRQCAKIYLPTLLLIFHTSFIA